MHFFRINIHANNRSPRAQRHLQQVYTHLAGTTGIASLASVLYYNGYLFEPGWITLILLIGSMLGVLFSPNRPSTQLVRHGALYTMGFAEGWLLGPIVRSTAFLDPQSLIMALVGTVLIFGSFSMSAYYSPRRQYLYLGGLLGTVMGLMALGSLAAVFFPGAMAQGWLTAELYLGLLLFSFYVLYDTQVIIERTEGGQRDVPMHVVMLFTDAAAIFVRLLLILSKDSDRSRNGRNKKK